MKPQTWVFNDSFVTSPINLWLAISLVFCSTFIIRSRKYQQKIPLLHLPCKSFGIYVDVPRLQGSSCI